MIGDAGTFLLSERLMHSFKVAPSTLEQFKRDTNANILFESINCRSACVNDFSI